MEKIKVRAELVNGEIIEDGINCVDKVYYNVTLDNGKDEFEYEFQGIREINGHKYSDEHTVTLALLSIFDYLAWDRDYDFDNEEDIDSFVDAYGFRCSTVCKIIRDIEKVKKVLSGIHFATDEINWFVEAYSDGGEELVSEARKKLDKYFEIETL